MVGTDCCRNRSVRRLIPLLESDSVGDGRISPFSGARFAVHQPRICLTLKITVDNRDYHQLSQSEIDGAMRIYQHLSRPENYNLSELSRSALLRLPISYGRGLVAIHQSHSAQEWPGVRKAFLALTRKVRNSEKQGLTSLTG